MHNRTAWDKFLRGHWSSNVPTLPGTYPVADYTGTQAGFVRVEPDIGPLMDWGGYWWSEPLPPLPAAPSKVR
jgi:hypothetical protein